jgi:L-amino acid N-acyltransferase
MQPNPNSSAKDTSAAKASPSTNDAPSRVATNSLALVRKASEQDLPSIRDIYNYFVLRSTATFAEEEETAEERLAWFDNHGKNGLPVLVAELDGVVVGWASLSFYHQRSAYRQSVEPSLYIHHEHASCGIGKLLTDALIAAARERNYHCIISLVCSENTVSLAVLAKYGFVEAGELKEVGRKFDRWLNVTIMQKML